MIQLDEKCYWLYAAVDPETNELIHIWLSSTRNEGVTSIFLSELSEKPDVNDTVFLVDFGPWLKVTPHGYGLRFDMRYTEIGTLPNISFR